MDSVKNEGISGLRVIGKLVGDEEYIDPDLSDSDMHSEVPVKVITNEDMWVSPNIPEGVKFIMSAADDVTVVGYPEDVLPPSRGVKEIAKVVKILEDSNIPCCMVLESALTYYGSMRVMDQWSICVPTDKLEEATKEFRSRSDTFVPFGPSALKRVFGIDHLFPRFKFIGLRLFFTLLPSKACHIVCEADNIEFSRNGIPYPKLHVYTQSLLETENWGDLEDLVDAMNLNSEWGKKNLNLEGVGDPEWTRWSAQMLNEPCPEWCNNTDLGVKKLDIWEGLVSEESKIRRQGWKYHESRETRYWIKGSIDPRLRDRNYC